MIDVVCRLRGTKIGARDGNGHGGCFCKTDALCCVVADEKATAERDAKSRKWLPSLAELIDRLSIVQLKQIFIPEHATEYGKEREMIEHDIDLLLNGRPLDARTIHAIQLVMLSNRVIWENESKARAGGSEQDKLLKFTHSINGIRNRAKNVIAEMDGGRKDFKLDCLAAELPAEFGAWNIFGDKS